MDKLPGEREAHSTLVKYIQPIDANIPLCLYLEIGIDKLYFAFLPEISHRMIGKEVVILSCTIKIVNNIVCHWKRVEPPHVTHSINRLMHESASTRARSFQLVTAPSCLLYSVGERWSILKSWCSFTAIVTNNFTDCEHNICQYFRLMDPVCWGKQIIQSGNASVITYQLVTRAKQVKWLPSVRIWARDSMILSPWYDR